MGDFRVLTNDFPIRKSYRGLKYIIEHLEKFEEINLHYDSVDPQTSRVVSRVKDDIGPNRPFLTYYRSYSYLSSTIEDAVDYLVGSAKRDIDWLLDEASELLRRRLESFESMVMSIRKVDQS